MQREPPIADLEISLFKHKQGWEDILWAQSWRQITLPFTENSQNLIRGRADKSSFFCVPTVPYLARKLQSGALEKQEDQTEMALRSLWKTLWDGNPHLLGASPWEANKSEHWDICSVSWQSELYVWDFLSHVFLCYFHLSLLLLFFLLKDDGEQRCERAMQRNCSTRAHPELSRVWPHYWVLSKCLRSWNALNI